MAKVKGLEFKVNLKNLKPKLPKSKVKSAYNQYMSELYRDVVPLVVAGEKQMVINKAITKVNSKHRDAIKDFMKDNISKSTDFDDIAKADSFGITLKDRVDKSVNLGFRHSRQQVLSLSKKVKSNKITSPEAVDKFVGDYLNNISKSLGFDSSRLIKNETRRVRMDERIEKLKEKPSQSVVWKLGDNENHCPVCVGYAKRYASINDVPEYPPIHPNCYCDLIVINEIPKTEYVSIKNENKQSRKELKITN